MSWKLLVLASLLAVSANSALASLGDDESSVLLDQGRIMASRQASMRLPRFTVHEIANNALVIREYADSHGKIFAVAWTGIAPPDFRDLLGDHLPEFQDAVQNTARQPGRRNFGHFESGELVLEQYGHQKSMRGRAYLPALLPNGVSADEIR